MSDFFLDANISHRIANMLAALSEGSHNVVHITRHPEFAHHNNEFGGNSTPDVEWISKLANSQTKWVVITGESDVIDTAHERAALIESGLTLFSLDRHWGKAGLSEQAWKIVKVWPELVKNAESSGPALYRINMGKRQSIETIRRGMRARGGKFRD